MLNIDIIIPTFNRAHLLERSILSVLNQTYKHFSLTVVDDGSTDETAEVVKKYPQVKLLAQKNAGVSAARNAGVKSSSHEWICFLDSDDEWLPKKLEKQVQHLMKHPELRFVHSEEFWIRNGVKVNPKVKHSKSAPDIFKRSLEFCLVSPSTVMMRRDLFLEVGPFDENFVVCEDYDLWLKVMINEKIGFINEGLINKYGGHEDQLSTKFPAMDYWRIKSLVRLLDMANSEQVDMIQGEIQKKAAILMQGYLKHGHQEKYDEIQDMVSKKR